MTKEELEERVRDIYANACDEHMALRKLVDDLDTERLRPEMVERFREAALTLARARRDKARAANGIPEALVQRIEQEVREEVSREDA